jgi:uncharacterized protein (DUF4415 family)
MATEKANMPAVGVADAEMPELTPEKLRTARSFAELLAARGIRRPGRPPSEDPKVRITIRLDASVVAHFRDKGAGWQTRLNEALAGLMEAERRPRTQPRSPLFSSYAKQSTTKAAAKKAPTRAAAKAAPKPAAKKAPAKRPPAKKAADPISARSRGKLTA